MCTSIFLLYMEPLPTCLHPNPGWMESDAKELDRPNSINEGNIVGKHCILELYDCDEAKINDEAFVRTSLTAAAKTAGATLLNLITHRFDPQGVTGLALLAESHISIHTWPEQGYAAVDVFTCGEHTVPKRACEFLSYELDAKSFSLKSLQRESPKTIRQSVRKPVDN